MSQHRQEGKDLIIFATAEDHKEPSTIVLPTPESQPGLILPNGEINWNCPCLGGMATGPCGVEFREAFTCFHNSEAEPKGSDCFDAFKEMHLCMAEYPDLYNKYDDDEKDLGLEDLEDIEVQSEGDESKSREKTKELINVKSIDKEVSGNTESQRQNKVSNLAT